MWAESPWLGALTPPHQRRMSTPEKPTGPLSGEEHRDADTPLLQLRLATTTPENAPSNPEASYPRADPSARGRDKEDRELYSGVSFVPWRSFLASDLLGSPGRWSSFVAGRVIRRILAALVGFWFVGSSPTVVGFVGALELGSPFPSTDSELHKCESVKPHEAARYPTRL